MSDWRQELIDFINAKSKEHADIPMKKLGYFRLMEQLARHQANHIAAMLQSEYRTYSPDNQPVDYHINPMLAEGEELVGEDQRAALQHWEKCFRDGTVDDEHAEFIAGVLAKARKEGEE